MNNKKLLLLFSCGLVTVLLVGTACTTVRGPERLDGLRRALDASAATASDHLDVDAARQRFAGFYQDFEPAQVRRAVPEVFAPDAYLNDDIHEAVGREAVGEYLTSVAEDFVDPSFVVEGAAQNGIDYYFRWVMSFHLSEDRDDPPITAPGMSHVRFDREGRILFQADHWDLNAVYERIPGVSLVVKRLRRQAED